MPVHARAADAAKRVLRSASHRLMTADPTSDRVVNTALDRSLDWSLGDNRIRPMASRSFEPSFAETDARALSFQVKPLGLGVNGTDQRDITNDTARGLIYEHFGPQPLSWYDQRSEGVRQQYGLSAAIGARYAMGLDGNGLREVSASYEWGPSVMDLLPGPVMSLAQLALQTIPSLRPFATTIRTSRLSGGQQISFEIPAETSLEDFKPLMEALGMGNRHGGFVTLLAFVLGARFALPPGVATLTLLHTHQGPELRLDVNIDALPDMPEQLLPLLRLPMTERPQNLAALDSWMTAMTPDGYYGPGSVTVLSVRVRPEMPARMALYLRPLAMDAGGEPAPVQPAPIQPAPIQPGAANGQNGQNGALPPQNGQPQASQQSYTHQPLQ